ncbi:hypothetical protein AR687_00750 [Flavobacteriaceae bacterium CRH]|nr:hypothetical protein AR687_00750 [Flavobacteriaceae bacterium CRH]
MQKKQLVSIIIPCYSQAAFLDETLSSVLVQTYQNWECLIINDGSPDNTDEIAQKWVEKDNRFKYFFKQNSGVSNTRNFGLEKATGEYIQFLDADDVLFDTKLELSLQTIENAVNEDIQILFTNFRMFTNNVKITTEPYCNFQQELFTYENLLYKWNDGFSIPIQTAFIKSSLLQNIRFPEHMTAQEDWIFWVNLFKSNPKVLFINQTLALYRVNMASRTLSRDMLEDQLKAYEYFKDFLNEEDFHKMSLVLISRYYKKSGYFITKYNEIKNSNTYKIGNLIKKSLRKLHILNLSKSILRKLKF